MVGKTLWKSEGGRGVQLEFDRVLHDMESLELIAAAGVGLMFSETGTR